MALIKCFKCKAESLACKNLPDEETNLKALAATGKHEGKCSSYLKIPGEQKSLIAKYTAENGIVAASKPHVAHCKVIEKISAKIDNR